MKKNNLQTTLNIAAWFFAITGGISLISSGLNIGKYGSETFVIYAFISFIALTSFSLVFFALSYIIKKVDSLTEQKQVENIFESIPVNSEFEAWKKNNPTKSINEFFATKKK